MVTILFRFTNASRSGNWLGHLNAHEQSMLYVTAIDIIKYHRTLYFAVFLR